MRGRSAKENRDARVLLGRPCNYKHITLMERFTCVMRRSAVPLKRFAAMKLAEESREAVDCDSEALLIDHRVPLSCPHARVPEGLRWSSASRRDGRHACRR